MGFFRSQGNAWINFVVVYPYPKRINTEQLKPALTVNRGCNKAAIITVRFGGKIDLLQPRLTGVRSAKC